MCLVDDSEQCTVYVATVRKARKEHKCFEACGRPIVRGETYESVAMLYEGHWETLKSCSRCVAARAWLVEACDGFLHGAVEQDLGEHWAEGWEYRTVALALLLYGYHHHWTWKDGTPITVAEIDGFVDRALVPIREATAAYALAQLSKRELRADRYDEENADRIAS